MNAKTVTPQAGRTAAARSKSALSSLSENPSETQLQQILATHFDYLPPVDSDAWVGLDLNWHPALKSGVQQVINWYETQRGGIVLAGGFGCGKTHLAQIVSIFWGYTGRMISEPDLIANVRKSYRESTGHDEQQILSPFRRSALLILDDVGTAHVKSESADWYGDILWRIFDTRAQENLATLITTNLNLGELSNRVGGRAFDRLGQLMGRRDNFVDMSDIPSYRWKNW